MHIESKEPKLTFWRLYWWFVAVLSLQILGLIPLAYFSAGRLPWVIVEAALLFEVFVFPVSYLLAGLLVWTEAKRKVLHWQISPSHVEVFRGNKLLLSLPWPDVLGVTFRRGIMGLKVHRFLPTAFYLKGIIQSEFDQVEATRRAGLSKE
jgi:hypothetical protein